MSLKLIQFNNGLKINLFTLFSILTFLLCDSSFLIAQVKKYNDFRSRKSFINDSLLSLDQRMHKFELKHKTGYEGTTNFRKPMIEELSINLGNDEWTTNGPYGGGTFMTIAVAPGDSNIVYAISDGIGLYKSIDAGVTWTFVEALKVRYINTIAIDPNNPEIIYAMDYKSLYKSTDSGATWHKKDKNISAQYLSYGIIINPENSDVIYIGATNEILKSEDGGETWRTVLDSGQWFTKLIFDPTDTNIIYAADMQGVWRSDDAGDTWDFFNSGFPDYPYIYGLAVDSSNPDILYAGANGLYRSNDRGLNWSLIGFEGERIYWGIIVDPSDSQKLYVGTVRGFYKTSDRGAHWEHITTGIPSGMIYDIELNPQRSSSLYCGTSCNGILKSSDYGDTWHNLETNSKNRITKISIASDNSDIIFASSAYGGVFKSSDKGQTWERKNNGLLNLSVNSVVIDPSNSNIVYCCSDDDFYKSSDGAESWDTINTGLENIIIATSITIAPTNSDVLFATTLNGLYRTKNGGESWERIGFEGKYLSGIIAIHPFSSDIIYQGVWDEGLYRTENGGIDWVLINKNLENHEIVELAIDIVNPDIIYASTYKYGVFKSHDGGDNWEYAGLAGYYMYDLIIDAQKPDILYAACYNNDNNGGVYITINGAQNWASINQGLDSPYVLNLAMHPDDHYHLFAGTAYDGVWDYSIQNYPPIVEIHDLEQTIFEDGTPITFTGYGSDQEDGDLPDSVMVWSSSLQGELGRGDTLTVDTLMAGKHTIIFNGEDSFGMTNQDSVEITILPEGVGLIAILEAETDMTPFASSHWGDGLIGWRLNSNGSLESNQPVHFPEKRTYAFTLLARGTNVKGWPLCNLTVGEEIKATHIKINSSEYTEFIVPAIIDSGNFLVDVAFTNYIYDNFEGSRYFALDKLIITAPLLADHDIAVQSILSPGNTINPLAETTPKVEIVNFAQNPETNVPVTCVIEKTDGTTPNEVYRNQQTLSEIAGFAVDTVAFEKFQPTAEGTYQFTFFHEMPDADPANDSLRIETRTALFFDATQQANVSDMGPGFGVAVGDYDNDGFWDIYHTRGNENVLFHNRQDGTFENLAAEAGLEDLERASRSAGWFDFDNDNDLDLLILNQAGIALYRNANGRFTNISWAAGGFGDETNVTGLGIGDYNNDGFLDFYATRYGEGCFFFSNNRNGTFSDITDQTVLRNYNSSSSSALFFDFDQDGDQDLLVSSHSHEQRLFRNNGDTTFTNVAEPIGIHGGGNAHHVMVFDYNNDGWLDVYFVCGQEAMPANILFRNNGGTFTDVSEAAGINDRGDGRGGATGDFDADGFLDIYVVNNDGPNVLYHNNGDGTFKNISAQAGVDNPNRGFGTAVADFDADGDLDIYLANDEQPNVLYYNSGTPNNWVHVKTTGVISNRDGIGARVEVYANDMKMMRQIDGSPGLGSQSNFVAEFGVGQATQIDRLVIYWPSGVIQDTSNLAVNQLISFREPVLEHDFGIVSLLAPGDKTTAGVPIHAKIRIKNYGRMAETAVTVSMSVDSAGVTIFQDDQIVPELRAMKETEVTFAGYAPQGQAELWFSFSCNLSGDENLKNDSLRTRVLVSGLPYFINVAASLDLDSGRSSHGVAFADYDLDGDFDLYVANCDANILYKNNGNGTFSDATNIAWVGDQSCATGCVWADYNDDGFPDIYISNINQANTLYAYLRDGRFSNRTNSAQVGDTGHSWGVAFCDYDRDGFLDLFVAHDDDQTANVLYQNNGDATFTNVAAAAGLAYKGFNSGAAFGDYDNDGDPDLYVANRIGRSLLYRNNGDGTFTNVAVSAKVAESGNAHGVAWGDYDNDGWLDLFVTTAATGDVQSLYHNEKNGTFRRVSESAGLGRTGNTCRSVIWLDYDYDGWLDLYLANEKTDILYRNNGNGIFTEISSQAGIQDQIDSWDIAFADYDLDGDLDIFVPNNGPNIFYQHQGTPNNWLIVKPVGSISNHDGIGTRVTAISESFSQIREVTAGSGLGSQNMLPVAFGLATDTMVDSLIIRWPSGIRQVSTNVAVNQYITVKEDSALIAVDESDRTSANLPVAISLGQNFPNPFNPDTKITYQLPKNSHVHIAIYNVTGKVVKTLIDASQQAGFKSINWNGRDNAGCDVSSGVYFYQLKAHVESTGENFVETRKMVLVR